MEKIPFPLPAAINVYHYLISVNNGHEDIFITARCVGFFTPSLRSDVPIASIFAHR